MHHFLEDHLDHSCPNCRKNHHKEWKPQFHLEMHYKTLTCDCGYKVFKKLSTLSSGHY
ncbi:MAG TPA: hypothetical protein VJG90_06265 [Candidatus Nanoarchaeia archaeon]|nr:hypothetical protein [Candidatus Nanoarchaeia archaeon]